MASDSLYDFLRSRAVRSFTKLLNEIEDVRESDALRYSRPDWPDHEWGVGQNGSISGIIYHVAAWKLLTLPVFDAGGRVLARSEFDTAAAPDPADWEAVFAWLNEVGEEWNRRMLALSPDEFYAQREWEGRASPVSAFVVEMMEHDIQHASQIAYLRQRIAAEGDLDA